MDEISQDVIVLFDEIEKIFGVDNNDDDDDDRNSLSSIGSLLSLLDGTSTNTSRRFWLFTSNTDYLDRNLLDRPSRIRYCKQFKALETSTIIPIVDDLLKIEIPGRYDEIRLDLLKTIGRLEHRTIDAIFALVEEVNIHQELASELIGEFNLNEKTEKYMVTRHRVDENGNLIIDPEKEGKDEELRGIYYTSQINMRKFSATDEENNFCLRRKFEAQVVKAINETQAIMKTDLPTNYEEGIDEQGNKVMINTNDNIHIYWLYTLEPVYESIFDL
jgi:ATP-dependent 26S proteasome regulatory subunit